MSVSDLKAKIEALEFRVIDKQYGPGYGGANYGDRVDIDYRTFAAYVARGDYRTNYLILHEVAHNSELGLASRSWNVNTYRDRGSVGYYGAGNIYFEQQERTANTIAKNIANALGISITSPGDPGFPPSGFDY